MFQQICRMVEWNAQRMTSTSSLSLVESDSNHSRPFAKVNTKLKKKCIIFTNYNLFGAH